MKIEVFKGEVLWFWHFKARNGRIMWQGEAHATRAKALRAARRCNELLGKNRVPLYLEGVLHDKPTKQ